jgi:hypothetical protein
LAHCRRVASNALEEEFAAVWSKRGLPSLFESKGDFVRLFLLA